MHKFVSSFVGGLALACLVLSPMALASSLKVIDSAEHNVIPPDYESITYNSVKHYFELVKAGGSAAESKSYADIDGNIIIDNVVNLERKQKPFDLPPGNVVSYPLDDHIYISGPSGLMGAYSTTGRPIIPAEYSKITYNGDHLFTATKLSAAGGPDKIYLVKDGGKVISELPSWTRTESSKFHEGLLRISNQFDPTRFIDRQGKLVKVADYDQIQDFYCGRAAVSYLSQGKRWAGYLDHQGKMVIGPFENVSCSEFDRGRATIMQYSGGEQKSVAVVDTAGKFVIPFGQYSSVRREGSGDWFVTKDNKFEVLDKRGRLRFKFPDTCTSVEMPPKITPATWIPCGFGGTAPRSKHIGKAGSKWGYCDATGKIVLAPKFFFCSQFTGDLAMAWSDTSDDDEQHCGVIDRKGNWVVQPHYEWLDIATPNRFIASEKMDEQSANMLHRRDPKYIFRGFAKLLETHDLIGMSREELEKLVGKLENPVENKAKTGTWIESATYCVMPGAPISWPGCVIEFRFDKGNKVVAWNGTSPSQGSIKCPWITENVLIEHTEKGVALGNLVPKSN
ncbi:MAG: WG repeat-containing protein [Cyanobacteria bacterium SZAS-4]|nr:WG repeat-containing protein [Cyanobacteria bacterium SZAS-4]